VSRSAFGVNPFFSFLSASLNTLAEACGSRNRKLIYKSRISAALQPLPYANWNKRNTIKRKMQRLQNSFVYVRSLSFDLQGIPVETPDLARFLTAQSGVEMLECLKRNFFADVEVPLKWEFGVALPIATYFDQFSCRLEMRFASVFPSAEMRVTRRD
jgi:hypothetical protein